MPSRELPYPVFDADNHFYEPKEALTQFVPDHRKGVIDYIDINGRTKIVVRKRITDYIPNPTFEVVARPGAQESTSARRPRQVLSRGDGQADRVHPGLPRSGGAPGGDGRAGAGLHHHVPDAGQPGRGADEGRPELILDMIHALNQWMYETWRFDYEGRIFSTPVINLSTSTVPSRNWVVPGPRREDGAGPPRPGARLPRHPVDGPA